MQTKKMNIYQLKLLNFHRKIIYKKIIIFLRNFPLILTVYIFSRSNKSLKVPKQGRILLIFNDAIGDMVVRTGFIRSLSESGYNVYVSSKQSSLELLKYNPYISGVFLYDENNTMKFISSILNIRKQKFDLAIETRIARKPYYKDMIYYALIKSPILIGCNKGMFKTFNLSIPCKLQTIHVTEPLRKILDVINGSHIRRNMSYNLFTSMEEEKYVLDNIPENDFVIFNPLGSKETHCLSFTQAHTIYKLLISLGYSVLVIGEAKKIKLLGFNEEIIFPSRSIIDIVPLVKKSKLILTVDTSIVHIASAFNKTTIAIYPRSSRINIPPPPKTKFDEIEYKYWLYYTQMEYGLYNIPAHELSDFFSISTVFWHPNNPNGIQIVVDSDCISSVPTSDLIIQINNSLTTYSLFQ